MQGDKVLFHVPVNRWLWRAMTSWLALDPGPYRVDYYFTQGNPYDAPRYPGNILVKLRRARDLALSGGYDWLLNVEDDVVIPSDTLLALASCGARVASGLYLLRPETAGHVCYAARIHDPSPDRTSDDRPIVKGIDFEYGDVISVVSVGFGCVLIHRGCLARWTVTDGLDVDFSRQMREIGQPLYVNTAVRCGHITADGSTLEA